MNPDDILKKLSNAKYEFDQATHEVHKTRQAVDKARKKQDKKIKELKGLLEAVYKQNRKLVGEKNKKEEKCLTLKKK